MARGWRGRGIPGRCQQVLRAVLAVGLVVELVVGLVVGGAAQAQVCGAAGGDNRPTETRCAQGLDDEPASPPGDAPVTATAASIDLVTGNKYLRHTDARWPDGLVLTRHYNSRNGFARSLGPGWSHSWDTVLVRRSAIEWQVIQGDGRRRVFRRAVLAGGRIVHRSADPLAGQIEPGGGDAAAGGLRWQLPDARVLDFDRQGRLLAVDNGHGIRIALVYDPASGWLATVRNAAGVALHLVHDERGRLVALRHPDGRQTRYVHDAHGLLVSVQEADGTARHHAYSAPGLPHALTRITDGKGALIGEFDYNEQGRAIASRMTGQPGIAVDYRLPERAGEPGETTVTYPPGAVTRYRWRYLAHPHRPMLLQAIGPGCPICPPAGVVRRHDALGRVLREDWLDQGLSLDWQRDALGRVLRLAHRLAAGPGRPARIWVRRFEYLNGQADSPLAAVHDPSVAPGRERSLRWSFDADRRVVSATLSGHAPDLGSLDSQLGVTRWRRVERSIRFGYETAGAALGRLAWIDGPLPGEADRVRWRHDESGRLVSVSWPQGLSGTFEHDPQGRLTGWRDPDGRRARLAPDVADMLVASTATLAFGSPERFAPPPPLPPFGRTVFTDALGARTVYWHDDLGNRVAEAGPQQGVTLNRHDEAGHLVGRIHESGATESFTRDALGRLVARGDAAQPHAVRYTWQGTRLVAVSDPVQTIAHHHDARGRLQAEAVLIGERGAPAPVAAPALVSVWQRDAHARVVAEHLPGGHVLRFVRDADGQVSSLVLRSAEGRQRVLVDSLRWQSRASHPPRLVGYRAGNSVRVEMHRDEHDRLIETTATLGRQSVLHQRLRYDALGRIIAIERDGESLAYAYDPQGRLIGAADRSGAEGFAHDANGNRLVRLRMGPTGAGVLQVDRYRHDREGRLLSITRESGAGRVRHLARSPRGDIGVERVTRSGAADPPPADPPPAGLKLPAASDDPWRDARLRGVFRGPHGRALAAFADERLLAVYDYDANGLRVRRVVGSHPHDITHYLHRNGLLTGLADHQGRLRRWIVRLGPHPLAELRFEQGRLSSVRWLLADQRGAPLRALDEQGRTVWRSRAGAFGDPPPVRAAGEAADGPPDDPGLRLSGQWFDPETGRHENGWRSYIPEQGRYAQPDPLGPAGGPNERTYAGGDPVGRIDPFGLYEIDVHYYLTYFLARAAGVSAPRAHIVSLASQYVDDNPLTRPESPFNLRARERYHFVMDGHDRSADAALRYRDPRSPQLDRLLAAAHSPLASDCARLVFFGEYLHVFEDSFAHRDAANVPFGPRLGHAGAGHDPDQTYDVINSAAPRLSVLRAFPDYTVNEARSLRMAQETHAVLGRYFGTRPLASFSQIESVVRRFMRTGADTQAALIARSMTVESAANYTIRKNAEWRDKMAVLDEALRGLGLGIPGSQGSRSAVLGLAGLAASAADARGTRLPAYYSAGQAAANRRDFLAGLSHDGSVDPFPGVLLPGD